MVVLVAALLAAPVAARTRPAPVAFHQLANHCFAVRSSGFAGGRYFFKPTDLGTFMLYDRSRQLVAAGSRGFTTTDAPGAAAEWRIAAARRGRFLVRSTAAPGVKSTVTVRRARGCIAYPEASVGATGSTFKGKRRDGTVVGWADPHIHVTADLRAGGMVISGHTFDRFGITEALGHDADVHGPNGSLDITGNLLRSGSPTGTHDTDGWPTFAGWPTYDTYTHQQVYWRWLERAWMSGLRLLGAQLVEDEPLCAIEPRKSHSCDETSTIELEMKELRGLQDYVDAQFGGRGRGFLRIVYDPRSARRVIERGKLAVIVGVESSDPFGCSFRGGQAQCTKEQIDAGIDRLYKLGVRTIFPAHWVDNALAGAALEGDGTGTFISAMQLSYDGQPFSTGACPEQGQGETGPLGGGKQCNTRGLTDLGAYAINRLMDKHMLIEADHLSEVARLEVLAIAEQRHYPLVSSHTNTGGFWTPDDLRRLYGVGGFSVARLGDAKALPDEILGLRRYQSLNRTLGAGLGSDTGGFASLPGPQPGVRYPFRAYRGNVVFTRERTGARTYDLTRDGVAHYGLVPDLLAAVEAQPRGRAALGLLFHSAEAYLEMWERADPAPRDTRG